MKHPGPDELVDLLEDAGSGTARAHVAACAACRTRLAELRAAAALATAVDVPEPSPLFWDHLSARVRERIAEDPPAAERASIWTRILGAHGAPARKRSGEARLRAPKGSPRATEPGSGAEPRLNDAWRWVMPIALAFGVVLLFVARMSVDEADVAPTETATATDVDLEPLPVDEDSWAVLASMSEDLTWDEVDDAGLTVTLGAADRAALDLTVEEQQELVRLLRAEIGPNGT